MIHPNCSELVIKVEFEDLDDLKSLIRSVLEKTSSAVAVDEWITSYSKTPLSILYDREHIYQEIDLDDVTIADTYGVRHIGIHKDKLPHSLVRKLPSWLMNNDYVSVYVSRGNGSVFLSLDDDFVEFNIGDGDEDSFNIFADISRALETSPFPNGGGSLTYFLRWCRKNGYEDIVKDCLHWGYSDDTS